MNNRDKPTLSDAFAELEKITAEFERGDVDLEKGIPKFQRGLELARFLKKRLSRLENQIEEINAQFTDVYEDKTQQKLVDEETEEMKKKDESDKGLLNVLEKS